MDSVLPFSATSLAVSGVVTIGLVVQAVRFRKNLSLYGLAIAAGLSLFIGSALNLGLESADTYYYYKSAVHIMMAGYWFITVFPPLLWSVAFNTFRTVHSAAVASDARHQEVFVIATVACFHRSRICVGIHYSHLRDRCSRLDYQRGGRWWKSFAARHRCLQHGTIRCLRFVGIRCLFRWAILPVILLHPAFPEKFCSLRVPAVDRRYWTNGCHGHRNVRLRSRWRRRRLCVG